MAQPTLSLARRQHPLADPRRQLQLLAEIAGPNSFQATLAQHQIPALRSGDVRILQLNVGRVCNMTCRHCHVDAGPDRRESMSDETIDCAIDALRRVSSITTLDITGGAPEMHPRFRDLIIAATSLGKQVIDRCNLTILLAPGFETLIDFLARHRVEIVASLPCYLESNVDAQRGNSAFSRSIEALRQLNAVGYGRQADLPLTLVYNPVGPSLPPDQKRLEADYRRELAARYDLHFTRLFTITNMPISRFLEDLADSDRLEAYLERLRSAFNPAAVSGLMCHHTLSVAWDGQLFDCDFNQMLELPVAPRIPATLAEWVRSLDQPQRPETSLVGRPIATAPHCFGCTAGAGSSCQGSLTMGS